MTGTPLKADWLLLSHARGAHLPSFVAREALLHGSVRSLLPGHPGPQSGILGPCHAREHKPSTSSAEPLHSRLLEKAGHAVLLSQQPAMSSDLPPLQTSPPGHWRLDANDAE
jgi:hypothetical protein